jgi:flagellar protein FliO/FliZ
MPIVAHAQATPPTHDLGGNILQLIFGLAIVIALLLASLWLLKRLSAPRGEAAGLMRIVAGTAVGSRERVVVLEVADTWLILGVAPGRVTALAEMPRGKLPTTNAAPGDDAFTGRLRQLMDRPNAR